MFSNSCCIVRLISVRNHGILKTRNESEDGRGRLIINMAGIARCGMDVHAWNGVCCVCRSHHLRRFKFVGLCLAHLLFNPVHKHMITTLESRLHIGDSSCGVHIVVIADATSH